MDKILYKVSLFVNFNEEVNLKENVKKIIDAAEEFSENSNHKKVLTPSCIEKDKITFLIAFNTNRGYEKFTLKSVIDFLKLICSIYNIEYNSRKKYFSLEEEGIPLLKEEYDRLRCEADIYITTCLKDGTEDKEDFTSDTEEHVSEDDKGEVGNVVKSDNIEIYMSNKANIKLPKRNFPVILNGNARFGGNDKREGIEYTTLSKSMKQLNTLIGLENIKKEIREITSFIIRNNERCVSLNIDNPGLYYNTVISGNKGTGKNTLAKILYHIFYHLGVIGKGKFAIVDGKEIYPGNTLDRFIGNTQSGVILIDNAHLISTTDRRGTKDNFSTLDDLFSEFKDNFIFILVGETEGINELMKYEKIKKNIDFFLNVPDFTEKETLKLVKRIANKEKYNIDVEAEDTLFQHVAYLKQKNIFENAFTARRMVEKAIIKNGAVNNSNYLVKEDFFVEDLDAIDIKKEKSEFAELDPFEELEGMIGLNEVKKKVKEISDYAAAQLRRKELGLKSEALCLHMNFVGNPGTGKTSVARCIGKILKKLGVLSTGKFVEVGREDLVGRYVGHTAVKTAEKIKEAEGGVLFLDEAYSLDSNSTIDFGREAINTLVKHMEDKRDNLVVIFAGYPKEMSKFITMNPGLRERIQFKLEFVDYKPNELFEIWKKFFESSEYQIDKNALYEMNIISNKLYENRDSNFSNGRIMRKCFERAKMHQAVRIIKENQISREDVVKITLEDIKCLYEDADIAIMLEEVVLKRCIGFAR